MTSVQPVHTLIMGIVNATPDSFSDGGLFTDPGRALAHMRQLVADGADILDLGAESSRPGASAVDADEEWRRLKPILEGFARADFKVPLSLDTYKPEIMRRALDYPVRIINDIRGGADADTLGLLARKGITYLAMHMHRQPDSMQEAPLDAPAALRAVAAFYEDTTLRLRRCGFPSDRIWLDPGIGFGKSDAANIRLLQQAHAAMSRFPIVIGISRKSFIGRLLDLTVPADRDGPSKMLELNSMLAGAKAIRTHQVAALKRLRDLLQEKG